MDIKKIKRAVDSIELPDAAKARIKDALQSVGKATPGRRIIARPGVLIAAVLIAALLVTGAGAACVSYFTNRTVIPSGDSFSEATFLNHGVIGAGDTPAAYSVEHAGDDWGIGLSVEEQYGDTDSALWKKFRTWSSSEYIAGSTRAGEYDWTGLEVIQAEGDVLIRDIFDVSNGAVKREYMAFDPADFVPYAGDFFAIDCAAIEENYTAVEYPWLFYTITDKHGTVKGLTYKACYAAEDGKNFTMDYFGDYWVEDLGIRQEYILESEYDSVYTYTNASGGQFLIRAKDDVVVAECRFVVDEGQNYNSDNRFSLHANFMTASEVEAILECIDLRV